MDKDPEADLLRRIITLLMVRSGINNLNYSRFELDLAPVAGLMVTRDANGNVNSTLES